ncbi:MAG TPA: DUF6266 family protein [Ginsengibacter sp.]
MARIINGINGGFTGRVGTVTGYTRNGVSFMRSRHRDKDNIKSEKRLAQQQKIKVCNEFTKPFSGSGFFNTSFPANGATSTGYNRATSAIMNQAIIQNPVPALSYPLVLVSRGMLPAAVYASALVNDDGNIVFSWTDNTGTGTAKEDDKVLMVAYFPESKKAVYEISTATRKNCTALLQMNSMKGIAETWIGFVSADETNASDSVYTGSITM